MCAKPIGSDLPIATYLSKRPDGTSELCLVITEGNALATDKIGHVAADLCHIERCGTIEEVAEWLRAGSLVRLIVTDAGYEKQVTTLVRKSATHQHIPVLVISRSVDSRVLASSLKDSTDILVVTESDTQLKARLRYYLELARRVQEVQKTDPTGGFQRFRLPWWKRLLDIAVSLTALIILSPLLLLVAVAVVIDSKGPAFYTSKRAGTNFRVFNMYKYRTMRVDADQQLKRLADHNIYAKTVSGSE